MDLALPSAERGPEDFFEFLPIGVDLGRGGHIWVVPVVFTLQACVKPLLFDLNKWRRVLPNGHTSNRIAREPVIEAELIRCRG
jgi:hypothetical protein